MPHAALLLVVALLVPAALAAMGPAAAAESGAEDDCGAGRDAPDGAPGARLEAPIACEATFGPTDERDFYRFDVPHGSRANVTVTPALDGQQAVLCVYPPGWFLPIRCAHALEFTSYDPREWRLGVVLCATSACDAFGRGAYNLSIAIEGDPSPTTQSNGSVLLGAPLGPHVNRALGPGEPDGVDGGWHAFDRPTTMRDFVRLQTDDCASCLHVRWQYASGNTYPASCVHTDTRTLDCRTPTNATRMLVGIAPGHVDVGYRITTWYARA